MQFYFIMYTCNYHLNLIHDKGWYSINNKICIKLMVVFFYKGQNTCVVNFVILNESDFL
jgi:hypothetical protein